MAEYIEREAYCAYLKSRTAEFLDDYGKGWSNGIISARRIALKFPAADVATVVHWVLTDEKLPPDGQDVLCWYEYFRYGAFNRMYQTYGIGFQFNGNWGGEVANGRSAKVLAWMPLPEPPKMDGGDNGDAD